MNKKAYYLSGARRKIVTLTDVQAEWLENAARAEGVSEAQVVRDLIDEAMEK